MDDLKVLFKKNNKFANFFYKNNFLFFFFFICLKICQMETDILIVHLISFY